MGGDLATLLRRDLVRPYAGLMKPLTGFAWRPMLVIYAQSLVATLATVAPLLRSIAGSQARPPSALAAEPERGRRVLAWLVVVYALRHPIRVEINAILRALSKRPMRRGRPPGLNTRAVAARRPRS